MRTTPVTRHSVKATPPHCRVIAELGVNHNGRVEEALALVDAAQAAGADAVKIQIFQPAELCSGLHRAEERRMLEGLMLTADEHRRICVHAAQRQIPLLATPFDTPSLRLLLDLDIPVIKLGSGEVTHVPFLRAVGQSGRPVILSTGGCELHDIERAVATLRHAGCTVLTLLHCVSAYPPPDEELNLRLIPALAARFPDCEIGFSDHTLGSEAAVAAVALGAQVVEKHLTLDTGAPGPDHAASATPAQFAEMIYALRRVERQLGVAHKCVMPCEGRIGRSIVAARPLRAGSRISADDLAFKRPAGGFRPYALPELVGRALRRDLAADEIIRAADLDSPTGPSAGGGEIPSETRFVPTAPDRAACAEPSSHRREMCGATGA